MVGRSGWTRREEPCPISFEAPLTLVKGDERVELAEERLQLFLLLYLGDSDFTLLPILDIENKFLDIHTKGTKEVLPIHEFCSRNKCPELS